MLQYPWLETLYSSAFEIFSLLTRVCSSEICLRPFCTLYFRRNKTNLSFTDNRSLTQFFSVIKPLPSSWKCWDFVISFTIPLANIPGEAKSAAVFLSRRQTDHNLKLQIKLTDPVTVRENETKTKPTAPDFFIIFCWKYAVFGGISASFSWAIRQATESTRFSYGQFLVKQPNDDTDKNITQFLSFRSPAQATMIKTKDF